METNAKLLWFIGLYLILMIALGIKYATEAKDSKDFVLAGSGLGVFTLVGTLVASWGWQFGIVCQWIMDWSRLVGSYIDRYAVFLFCGS